MVFDFCSIDISLTVSKKTSSTGINVCLSGCLFFVMTFHLLNVFYAEAYSEPVETSKMWIFAKIVIGES